ncbi:MAG: efflux RND transporter permease subunit [Actinomycetaceae bacterium]|nr:efflux RND transporter permease subunit [Actinomycetaceae bacterium]MDY5854362.1 efflux RND transporter permease subunit [Arcanobacterium sp.]
MFTMAKVSLKNRAFVALVSVVIAVLGVFAMSTLRQELIPSVQLPQISVLTTSVGATSEQMKERVSVPIEQAVSTIAEVESTRTQSSSSFSLVSIQLAYGSDVARATSKVELAISRVKDGFPQDAEPRVMSGGTSSIPLSYVAVTSSGSPLDVAQRIRSSVIPQLQKVSGVSQVQVIGAPEQVVRIGIDTEKVRERSIDSQAIQDALDNNGLAVPVGALAGEGGNTTLDVTVGKKLLSLEELKNLPIAGPTETLQLPDGSSVERPSATYLLKEIASVELGEGKNSVVGRLDGKEALALLIFPTANANLVETSAAVNNKLSELSASVGADTRFTSLFEQAPYITQSVRSLAEEGAIGLGFAVIVILFFLLSFRSTLVTAVSVPLSLLAGFIGMLVFGYTINMLTLAALTLTIGRVVDDSIVVIENIKRHLDYSQPKLRAILDAVREVASAVTASTLVSIIVFVPIGLVGGMVGELFKPFAFTVVLALAASLFVSLTIVPVLAYWFLKPTSAAASAAQEGESAAAALRTEMEKREERYWLRRAYRPALLGTQKYPRITLTVAVALLGFTAALVPALKVNLMGTSNEGMVMISQQVRPGASIEAKNAMANDVEKAIHSLDGVKSVATIASSGGGSMMSMGGSSNASDAISYLVSVDTSLDITAFTDDVIASAERAADQAQGAAAAARALTQTSAFSSSTQNLLGSGTVDVAITAPTQADLHKASNAVTAALTDLSEAKAVSSDFSEQMPAVQVTVQRDAAARLGLTENAVVGMIAAQMVEPEIGTITLDNIDTSIYLSIAQPVKTVSELREMNILGQPITAIADIEEVESLPTIMTNNGQTTATVSVTPKNNDNIGALTSAVQNKLADVTLPGGTVTTIGGAAEQIADSFSQLLLAIVAAILLIYVVLVWIFKSLLQPLLLLIAIPFAAIGSFAALLITGTALDLSAMVGMLMLTGIVVTNAVVLIDLINQYRVRGDSLTQAIYEGAMHRLRPIVMTALATVAAMIPMALGFSSNSGFISQPLAITVIGGLVSSTALTLVLLPVLYRLVEGAKATHIKR